MGKRSAKERKAGALAPVKLAQERSESDDETTLPAWVLCLCTPICRCKSCLSLPIEVQCLVLPALLSPFVVYHTLKEWLLVTDARILYAGALTAGALSYSPMIMFVFVDFLRGVYSNPEWSWSSRAKGSPAPWTEAGYKRLKETWKEREDAAKEREKHQAATAKEREEASAAKVKRRRATRN
eukprot:COSAG02_NODE_10950_length_1826_cov_1.661818_1_plen_182_part_00